ncbi:tail sheath and receptor binding protein [Achromobacter phage vB_AxyP_19-32_Axy11]|uniref:Uncharacterized protein n=1 Tax=Achromobacter phage vB_AxyP_19-32_Axy11 TaxID=2591042 RepID=A0A514CU44_9CAUD|nr:tail sheath and receptor binding protein [Achromobacter phage vB_AxyP_19-32_Axy11]QDH83997.1 hypothetical protein Axy11_071 [Achromobacter phage vB_AxyP_19-32_Axy11]
MSLDDYRKGRDCSVPPKWDPADWHTSGLEHLPSLEDERVHLMLANPRRLRAFNSTIRRFQNDYWVVDYNAHMVATILPEGERSFRVPVQWRTNQDFLGVRWMSKDTFSHPFFTYEENQNYLGLVLAFQHNPDEPDKFTVTIETPEQAFTYRLSPYVFNPKNRRWENLDKKYGTKKSYQEDIFEAGDFTIPDDQITPAWGRKDYIFILDFSDLRTKQTYTGPLINPRKVKMVSFDCTESQHGLGRKAFCALVEQHDAQHVRIEVGGIHTNAYLTPGDALQVIYRVWGPSGFEEIIEREFEVVSFTGFGTSNFSVIAKGQAGGTFIQADAFLGRYLQNPGPIKQLDATKYFANLTVSGSGVKVLRKRNYVQPLANMGMTAGFDDGYNLTPERQVKMTYDLGYRDWWTTYIGMSHYWKGLTAFEDKNTKALITDATVLEYPVLFAGQSNASIHFVAGVYPGRGQDAFQKLMTETWGINYAGVKPINGATGSTAADRMCSVNPNSEEWDPLQTSGSGGLWWWDLEADKPGPALLHCIEQVGEDIPYAVFWSQGGQDASALKFPGDRNPAPSIARTKLATKKVFEYMRSLWGANMPIIIQEEGWGWNVPNAEEPNIPVREGIATYLKARRNSWGDVELRWKSYGIDPALCRYRVEIYDPKERKEIAYSWEIPGTQVEDGYVYADFSVERNTAPMLEYMGSQQAWGFMRWRVTTLYQGREIKAHPWEDFVPLDDVGLVKKRVICGINSLIGGYFNDLSDPSDHGGTGKEGRKDLVAASTFRRTFAQKAGLRDVQVIPVMTVVGSSPINPMPYQPGFPPGLNWWDPVNKVPGPSLVLADAIVKSSDKVPDYFIESGPGESTGIAYAPEEDRPAILAQWRQSNIEMLAWMRANWGNPNLEIWFQGATTSFWGTEIPPVESNAEGSRLLRDLATDMAKEGIGFKMGSYVPGSNLYTAYYNEMDRGVGWIHYSLETYHAAAAEMGEALALDINRAYSPPDWTFLKPPTGIRPVKKANRDIVITWDSRPGIFGWYYVNRRLDTGAVISQGVLEDPTWTFTLQAQQQAYAMDTIMIDFSVAEYMPATQTIGASATWNAEVITGSHLVMPTNVTAKKSLNGDITFAWEGRPSHQDFWIENLDAADTKKAIFAKRWTTQSIVWTIEEQRAYYNNSIGAGFAVFRVSEYDPVLDVTSIGAEFNGEPEQPQNPMDPVTGLKAVFLEDPNNSNIKIMWDAPQKAGRDVKITNMSVATGNPLSTDFIGTENALIFTREQQVAAYGFTASIVWCVAEEHLISDGTLGNPTTWNAAPEVAQIPTNSRATHNTAGDVTMFWDRLDAEEWDVEILNVDDSSVVRTETVTVPYTTFTAAEMMLLYGFVSTFVMWRVRPRRSDGASNVKSEFSATATPE